MGTVTIKKIILFLSINTLYFCTYGIKKPNLVKKIPKEKMENRIKRKDKKTKEKVIKITLAEILRNYFS